MTIFYSIAFSLKEPKDNLYCYLPMFQYAALKRTQALKGGDTYALVCDPESALFLRRSHVLQGAKIIVAPKPRSMIEGMALKYILPGLLDLSGQAAVYMDLDILPLGPIDFNVPLDSLLVLPEGAATDSNYAGDDALALSVGLSAGFFAYRDGPRVRSLFARILSRLGSRQPPYYTLDQPFFNHCIAAGPKGLAIGLPPTLVSFNGHNNRETARLVNLCGDPGDGPLHFQKVVEFFLSTFLRS
jgi:hypothetical protein